MQRKASLTIVSALAAATAASPAVGFGHGGDQKVKLATYKSLIQKMPASESRSQLESFANLLQDYAVKCATTEIHTPELESQLNGMMTELESAMDDAGVARPAEQSATVDNGLVR